MTITITKTAEKLAEMFTENTGTHLLDSGGAYGRNWERNQGKTAETFLSEPTGTVDDWMITISSFQLCEKFLEYNHVTEGFTKEFRDWVDASPKDRWEEGYRCYNSPDDFSDWLIETYGLADDEIKGFNTYNWDNLLGTVLQGVEYQMGDMKLVALSVHGGCDVRGGYSDLVVFKACECWLYQSADAYTGCNSCHMAVSVRGSEIDYWDREKQDYLTPPEGWHFQPKCFNCEDGIIEGVDLGECWC
ncbi:MAG: hypothetical protein EBS38_02550 [Actinobacteria bacterium]|nr:hypothetical protein [Actinomycetota bacterium]